MSYEEYNRINNSVHFRPFIHCLSQDGIYQNTEEHSLDYYSLYQFHYFAAMYFKREYFNKQTEIDLSNFSPKEPTNSLLFLPEHLITKAVEIKKIIMMYMRDLPIIGNPSKWLDQITEALKEPYLKDEIYCFLIKQLTANMQSSSEMYGWELLNFVLSVAKPSRTLFSYILFSIFQSLLDNEIHVLSY